jgi:hypothetical protein
LCGFSPPHFARPGLCCAKPLFGRPKRRIQPERYATLGLNFIGFFKKGLTKYYKKNTLKINGGFYEK